MNTPGAKQYQRVNQICDLIVDLIESTPEHEDHMGLKIAVREVWNWHVRNSDVSPNLSYSHTEDPCEA